MPAHMVNASLQSSEELDCLPSGHFTGSILWFASVVFCQLWWYWCCCSHEISHAFGHKWCFLWWNGSLKDWWTESDYAAFKEKTQKVIDQFDGQESSVQEQRKLTVSENVADLGGIAAALEAAKREPDFSAEEFFHNCSYLAHESAVRSWWNLWPVSMSRAS